jgi:hypothetical protein
MPQTTLDHYVLPSRLRPNTYSPFLALPRPVREKIYVMADLGPDRFINLNCWAKHRWCPSSDSLDEPNPHIDAHLCIQREYEGRNPPDPLPVNLLLVCKVVSQEAQDVLYGTNCFAISRRDPGGLRGLERLSRDAIKNLRTLLIHITPCTCLAPHCIKAPRRSPHVDASFINMALGGCYASLREQLHNRSLSNTSRTDRRFFEQWERVWHRLAEHIVPDQLSLYIIGHVESRPIAEQILQPLYQLPTLRNSGICLGPSNHPYQDELRDLAATAVQRLTYKAVTALPQTFPFLSLPRELQLQILTDTPLVQDACIRIRDGLLSRCNFTHSCNDDYILIEGTPSHVLAAFCTHKCAAFRTGCSNATYATYFTQISYLGKAMADLATYVFFSQNAFSIYTWNPSSQWFNQGNLRGMHSFLTGLPSDALRRIRQLTIWLPPIDTTNLPYNHSDWPLWLASVQLLATKATLPGLALTIQIGNHRAERARLARNEHFTPQDQARILRAYEEDIIRPLMQLQGLKLLFLYVSCPFGRGNEEARVQVECKLEQMVMGSAYNAYCMGKPPPNDYSRPFLYYDDHQ